MDNFETKKQLILIKIEALKTDFEEFINQVSPNHWRTTGTLNANLNKMEHHVKEFTEISEDELKIPWVREALKLDN